MARQSSSAGSSDSSGAGELRGSPEVRTGLIQRPGFGIKSIRYAVIDGVAIFEGDIVLGTPAQMDAQTTELRQLGSGAVLASVGISTGPGGQFRWPNCRVPFDIDAALPNQSRVNDAIAHWESRTRYRFVLRTPANAATFPDWVTFRPGSGCSSSVGRQGGQQFVNLGAGCSTGNAIHEIGHTIGLWHEQSREDRNAFVTIHFDKILPGLEHNFDQHITDGDDIGAYDYGSIMHYPRDAFSVDGSDTITPTDPAAAIGQRVALSAGDIAGANSFCPVVKVPPADVTVKEPIKDHKEPIKDFKEPIKDHKEPLKDHKEPIKDHKEPLKDHKEPIKDHKEPLKDHKEPIKDFKEPIKDHKEPIKDFKEGQFDTLKEAAHDPIHPKGFDIPGVFPGGHFGGGMLPFAVATPHRAPGLPASPAAGGGADVASCLAALSAAIREVDALRAALQRQYDAVAGQSRPGGASDKGCGCS